MLREIEATLLDKAPPGAGALAGGAQQKRRSGLMEATISRDELKLKLARQDKFLLVETLPRTAYQHAHLPGAINLPPDQVTQLASTLLPDKTADIVVYCAKPT